MPMERDKYLCFLDESGQPSLSKTSSCWFFLTAVVFIKKERSNFLGFLDDCVDHLYISQKCKPPENGLHWRCLSHDRKIALSKKYDEINFCQINIGFWKEKFNRADTINNNQSCYRYASKLAIERISWFVDNKNGHVDITFSDRTNFSKQELQDYVEQEMNKEGSQIRKVFNPRSIEIKTFHDEKLLQISDHCASALGEAFVPDRYGNLHNYYAENFVKKFYFYKGNTLWKYGIKIMPHDNVSKLDFINAYPFTRDWFVKK